MFSLRHKSCLLHQTQDHNNNEKISESERRLRVVIITRQRASLSPPAPPHPAPGWQMEGWRWSLSLDYYAHWSGSHLDRNLYLIQPPSQRPAGRTWVLTKSLSVHWWCWRSLAGSRSAGSPVRPPALRKNYSQPLPLLLCLGGSSIDLQYHHVRTDYSSKFFSATRAREENLFPVCHFLRALCHPLDYCTTWNMNRF